MTVERLKDRITTAFRSQEQTTSNNNSIRCELMTHPGYSSLSEGGCGEGPDEFAQSADREHEMEVLSHPDLFLFYVNSDIELV